MSLIAMLRGKFVALNNRMTKEKDPKLMTLVFMVRKQKKNKLQINKQKKGDWRSEQKSVK